MKKRGRDGEGRMTMWNISRENLRDQWCHTPFPCILWSEFSHANLWATREVGKGSVPGCLGEIEIEFGEPGISCGKEMSQKKENYPRAERACRPEMNCTVTPRKGRTASLLSTIESQLSIQRFRQAAGAGQLVECLLTLREVLSLILTWLAWSRRGGTCLRCQKLVGRDRRVRSARLFLAIQKMQGQLQIPELPLLKQSKIK